ncbi:hypothetical protein RHMOL_Rhmol04G0214600 [Rhododendron molle]|uniref:Uncharacterized protein n=1 Tax=Rhododendron molle TaxID=49168 RepID=A0ACC0P4H0_RHOML|nr:hypothetical protein RHMOL_Rhmol04G0214600 [Rhododendron molle]
MMLYEMASKEHMVLLGGYLELLNEPDCWSDELEAARGMDPAVGEWMSWPRDPPGLMYRPRDRNPGRCSSSHQIEKLADD